MMPIPRKCNKYAVPSGSRGRMGRYPCAFCLDVADWSKLPVCPRQNPPPEPAGTCPVTRFLACLPHPQKTGDRQDDHLRTMNM
jgi:hypothetical protein